MSMLPIPQGAIFTISSGIYSDYSISGVFRANVEIDAESLRNEWLEKNPGQKEPYHFDERGFVAFLSNKGLMEQLENWEFHVSDYSKCDEMWVEPPAVKQNSIKMERQV